MNATATLFDAGELIRRPVREVAPVRVTVTEDEVTGVAGWRCGGRCWTGSTWSAEADRRALRPIGPGGYSGGECYRAVVEVLLAGGTFSSDRSLLDGATQQLRGAHRLPSHTTLWRFVAAADLGRAAKAAAVNRTMLARAWALGAGPEGGDGHGRSGRDIGGHLRAGKGRIPVRLQRPDRLVAADRGVRRDRRRVRRASPGRQRPPWPGHGCLFVRECVQAIPPAVLEQSNLWVRIDSAGYQHDVFAAVEALGGVFSITATSALERESSDRSVGHRPGHRLVGRR